MALSPDQQEIEETFGGAEDEAAADSAVANLDMGETALEDELDEMLDNLGQGLPGTNRITADERDAAPEQVHDDIAVQIDPEMTLPADLFEQAISGDDEKTPQAGSEGVGAGYIVPRPRVLTRILIFLLVSMLAVLAIGGALVANAVGRLVSSVRESHADRFVQVVDQSLPSRPVLTDIDRFEKVLAELPERAAELHLARARILLEEGVWSDAAEHFREARLRSNHGFTATEDLEFVDALILAQETGEAARILRGLSIDQLNDDQRAQALFLLGRLRNAE